MRPLIIIGALAGAALLSNATLVAAQGVERKERDGAQSERPKQGRAEREGPSERKANRGTAEQRIQPRESREAPGRGAEERRAVERKSRTSGERAVQERDRSERAVTRERDDARRRGKAAREQLDQAEQRSVDRVERGQQERGKQVQPARERESTIARRHEQSRQARVSLSNEQRLRVRNAFNIRTARVTNVRFTTRIGTRIPRGVRLYAVPASVIAILPAYRYYRYVVLEDTICVVDPATYEIIDVLDDGPYPVTPSREILALDLTPSERALVLDSIGADFPDVDMRINLALGAEIPPRVELFAFPDVVLDRIRALRDYRFVVVSSDVVVVDPRNRDVALVIRR